MYVGFFCVVNVKLIWIRLFVGFSFGGIGGFLIYTLGVGFVKRIIFMFLGICVCFSNYTKISYFSLSILRLFF